MVAPHQDRGSAETRTSEIAFTPACVMIGAHKVPVRQEAVPVRDGDRTIAVLSRDTNLASARMPSQLELTYLTAAGETKSRRYSVGPKLQAVQSVPVSERDS